MEWGNLSELSDVNQMVETLQESLSSIYLSSFPVVSIKRRADDKPWITNKIRSLIAQRQAAYPSGNTQLYRQLRTKVQSEVKSCKRNFYHRKVINLKGNNQGSGTSRSAILLA